MTKAVMFDLDNTLYSFTKAEKASIKEVHKLFNKHQKISFGKFKELFDLSRAEIKRELAGTFSAHSRMLYFKRIVEKTNADINFKLVLKLRELYWKTFLNSMTINPEAIETLKNIKNNNIKIGIVSNGPTEIQIKKLVKLKIEKYVDEIVTSQETGSEKPNNSMFLLALNKLDCLAEDSVMVGDSPTFDAAGANVLNITSVLIIEHAQQEISKFSAQKPNYTIKKLEELNKILNI